MQPVRKIEIRVGLIVVLALGAAVSLVLTADRVSLESRYRVTAWLDDAGGLRERSPVTLAGISVGTVEAIAADPASGRIRAVLAVHSSIDLPRDVRARLASSGLFGDSSLALSSAPGGGSGGSLAKDGSARLEVSPGFFDEVGARANRILDAADDLLSPASRADLKRLLASSADLAAHAAAVAGRLDRQGERIDAAIADLAEAARDVRGGVETLNRRLDPLLARAEAAVAGLDARIGAIADRAAVVAERAGVVLNRVDGLLADGGPRLTAALDGLRRTLEGAATVTGRLAAGEGVIGRLLASRELAAALDRMAVDLEDAARAVAERPSVLVFDRDETAGRRDAARRAHEKMRRALDGGVPAEPSASSAEAR